MAIYSSSKCRPSSENSFCFETFLLTASRLHLKLFLAKPTAGDKISSVVYCYRRYLGRLKIENCVEIQLKFGSQHKAPSRKSAPECIDYDVAGSRRRAQVKISSALGKSRSRDGGAYCISRAPEKRFSRKNCVKWKVIRRRDPWGMRCSYLLQFTLWKEGRDEMETGAAAMKGSDADIASNWSRFTYSARQFAQPDESHFLILDFVRWSQGLDDGIRAKPTWTTLLATLLRSKHSTKFFKETNIETIPPKYELSS